jgi:hypothetical protein
MLHAEVSTIVEAPPETVLDVYADWSGWPRLFPTISGVRLLRREGAKLVLEVDHVEGRVINELVVRLPDTLELWEEKRGYLRDEPREELLQAFEDDQAGRLGTIPAAPRPGHEVLKETTEPR